jgi:hypothetical protein
MGDEPRTFVDRAAAAIAASARPRDPIPAGLFGPAPPAGFRFVVGERVVDTITGRRGRVEAAYHGAASGARVYEVRLDDRSLVITSEEKLEPWSGI